MCCIYPAWQHHAEQSKLVCLSQSTPPTPYLACWMESSKCGSAVLQSYFCPVLRALLPLFCISMRPSFIFLHLGAQSRVCLLRACIRVIRYLWWRRRGGRGGALGRHQVLPITGLTASSLPLFKSGWLPQAPNPDQGSRRKKDSSFSLYFEGLLHFGHGTYWIGYIHFNSVHLKIGSKKVFFFRGKLFLISVC